METKPKDKKTERGDANGFLMKETKVSPGGYTPPKHRMTASWLASVRRYLSADPAHKVWLVGTSGTGKSYIASQLDGWDLDISAGYVLVDGKPTWSLDLTKIPEQARVVAGCFSQPLYSEFIAHWKPTKIYLIEVPPERALKNFLWKAANKRWSFELRTALGAKPDPSKGGLKTHPQEHVEGADPKVLSVYKGTESALLRQGIPHEVVVNDFKSFAGPAWHQENPEAMSREIIGLVMMWHATQDKYAKQRIQKLLIEEGQNPSLNPGWAAFVHHCSKAGVRLSSTVVNAASAVRNSSDMRMKQPAWIREATKVAYAGGKIKHLPIKT